MKKSGDSDDKDKFKDLKQATQKEIRRAYWKYIDSNVTTESEPVPGSRGNNMKRFWTFIKHKRLDGSKIPPLKSEGLLHTEPHTKSNILNHQFQKAFSEKIAYSDEDFWRNITVQNRQPEIKDLHITVPGVEKLLKTLNPHKAAGPDNITPMVLK